MKIKFVDEFHVSTFVWSFTKENSEMFVYNVCCSHSVYEDYVQ
jgi:hypothetical protein